MKLSRVFQRKNVLWTSIIVMLLVSVTIVNVTFASPDTHFWVDPPEAIDVSPLKIYPQIAEAPSTYAWEFYLSWDPSILELALIKEGTFLAGAGDTDFIYTPLDEANAKGEILIHCSLIGNLSIGLWPTGDGSLCTLGFLVVGSGSTLLNLFDTRLWDHLGEDGYPASTPYRNEDCFFMNVEEPSHDIRITDVTVLTPEVSVGEVANVTATVLNEGTETETFDLTVYADGTPIGTATVNNLPGTGSISEDRSFTYLVEWTTTTEGTFIISAYAEPHVNETDTADNMKTDGTVEVLRPPDLKVVKVTVITPEVKVAVGALGVINVEVMNEGPKAVVFDIVVFGNYPTVVTAAYGKALAAGATGVFGCYWPTWIYPLPPGPAPEGTYAIMAMAMPLPGEVDLADNMLPAGPEFDGKIIITYAEAELVEWKLKVNNKVGIGKGHKSTVDTPNTLKAYVGEGTRDVLVRAKFEITDSVGTIIAEAWSNVAFMPVGQTAIVEGSWTATYPGIFFITAYLYYGTAYPIIPDGMSRTQSLRVDT